MVYGNNLIPVKTKRAFDRSYLHITTIRNVLDFSMLFLSIRMKKANHLEIKH